MKNNKKLICVCIVFVVMAGVFYISASTKHSDELVFLDEGSKTADVSESSDINYSEASAEVSDIMKETVSEEPAETSSNSIDGCCYVCGSVKKPGVYEFTNGQRVNDLITAAGGLKKDAAPESLNLAEQVTDGQKIYVPSEKEVKDGSFENVTEYSDETKEANQSSQGKKVNINTADKETLMTLPGIGEAKANSIIAYREEHSSFQNIEEMKNVEGIKDGVFTKIQDLICVQ